MLSGIQMIKGFLSGGAGSGSGVSVNNLDLDGNETSAMIRQRELSGLFKFWQDKKLALGRLPARADFSPRELGPLLPHIALVDVDNSGCEPQFTFRLCGTQIAEDSGADLTGKTWNAYPNAEQMLERAHQLVKDLTPYYASNIQASWAPKNFHHYSVLALPLSSDNTTVNMILYGIVFHPNMN